MIFQRTENAWHFINQGLESMNYEEYKKAIPKFNKAISLEPHNHVAQLHKGRSLYKIGDYQNALQCFDTILKLSLIHISEPTRPERIGFGVVWV